MALSRDLYRARIVESLPLVLSHLDREPFSPTYGSFDRFHWAWGASDISNADLQRLIVPLSFSYRHHAPGNRHYRDPRIREWIDAALLFTCREQAPNGSFTQWYPNDNSIVSAGFVVHDLLLVAEMLSDELTPSVQGPLLECASRTGWFLVRYQERHGFNSNHQIGIAAALFDVFARTGETRLRDRALSILRRVFGRRTRTGGFFEYAGADPGYQTLGLAYLAACLERYPSEELAQAFDLGVKFAARFLSPITGTGGFGSRGTRLLYPSGFEIAARRGIAKTASPLVRRIIADDRCVTNRNTDIHNLAPILSDYVRAFAAADESGSGEVTEHVEVEDFFCPESTLFSLGRGACRIRGRLNGGMLQVEDTEAGGVVFSSSGYTIALGHVQAFTGVLAGTWSREGDTMRFRAYAQRSNRIRPSAWSFLALRLFQVTLGRFMTLNLLVKRALARLLIFRRRQVPVVLERTIALGQSAVIVSDVIRNESRERAGVRPCAEGYLSFMGSARYWDEGAIAGSASRVDMRVTVHGEPRDDPAGATQWDVPPGQRFEVTYTIQLTR